MPCLLFICVLPDLVASFRRVFFGLGLLYAMFAVLFDCVLPDLATSVERQSWPSV